MLTLFETKLHENLINKKYSRITYFNDFKEFTVVETIIKEIANSESGVHIVLNSGDVIPLEKIVSLDGQYTEHYKDIEDFTCDC
tara:strand:+ start:4694 stop:4945 length:252 start_codon:yes stop_codon:yes gene_type:complete